MRKYLAQFVLIVFITLVSLPAFAQAKTSGKPDAGRPAAAAQPASAEAALPKPKFNISRFKGPIGKRYVLPDGMILLVKEERSLPMVTISMIIRAGAVDEPYKKAGLAHLTAALLTKGAAGMSAMDISGKIDFMGASLGVGGSADYAVAHLTVLKKDLGAGFSLFSKVLIKPTFAQSEINRMKKDVKAGILREEQSPSYVAQKAYQKMVFGGKSPYGRPVEGTAASLDAITRDDIVSFHKEFYVPNNCIMAVVGDISPAEAKGLVAKYMASWKRKKAPKPSIPAPPKMALRRKYINRDVTQATILMGHVGVARDNPDYYKLYVMNYILGGGGFVSRILNTIRDNMGLAYDAYSYFDAHKYSGAYTVGMQTKNDTAKKAMEETLKIIKNMKTAPVTDKEISDAKDFIYGSFARRMDTDSKMADLLAQVEFYRLGLNYFEVYYNGIHNVTKKDVLDVAKKYLHPGKMDIVVVGNLKAAGLK